MINNSFKDNPFEHKTNLTEDQSCEPGEVNCMNCRLKRDIRCLSKPEKLFAKPVAGHWDSFVYHPEK